MLGWFLQYDYLYNVFPSRILIIMKKYIYLALIAVALLSVLPAGLYAWKLAIPVHFELSDASSRWADFGSFFGGVLGPFYALCAFVGVLITVYLQNRQISDFEKRAEIEEVQRLLSSTSLAVDGYLRAKPLDALDGPFAGLSLLDLIATAGTSACKSLENRTEEDEEIIEEILVVARIDMLFIATEFNNLAWLLHKFSSLSGSPIVSQFYKKRFEYVVLWLHELGIVKDGCSSYVFFEPAALRKRSYPGISNKSDISDK